MSSLPEILRKILPEITLQPKNVESMFARGATLEEIARRFPGDVTLGFLRRYARRYIDPLDHDSYLDTPRGQQEIDTQVWAYIGDLRQSDPTVGKRLAEQLALSVKEAPKKLSENVKLEEL